jgi:hypothetical protein
MSLRIETLEKEKEELLARLNGGGGANAGMFSHAGSSSMMASGSSGPSPPNHLPVGPTLVPKPVQLDAFQGGLALNAHGELRFYVRTVSLSPSLFSSSSISRTNCRARQALTVPYSPTQPAYSTLPPPSKRSEPSPSRARRSRPPRPPNQHSRDDRRNSRLTSRSSCCAWRLSFVLPIVRFPSGKKGGRKGADRRCTIIDNIVPERPFFADLQVGRR